MLRFVLPLFLLLCSLLRAETVNVVLGDPFRGGYGDVASNLIMVGQLRQTMPRAKFRILVSDEEQGVKLKGLLPSFNPKQETQTIGDVEYVVLKTGQNPPKAAYLFSFSTHEYIPQNVMESAPKALLFEEPSGNETNPMGGREEGRHTPLQAVQYMGKTPNGKTDKYWVFSGPGDTQAGMYLSAGKPTPPHTRAEMLEKLDGVPKVKLKGSLHGDYSNTQIAFVYAGEDAEGSKTALAYANAMAALAASKEYENKKILLITQSQLPPKFSVPPNMEVRSYAAIPFELTHSLIAHSDFPPYVTGSVSVSLALDYEKIPFYEVWKWKRGMAKALMERLKTINPKLKKYSKAMNILFYPPQTNPDLASYSDTPEILSVLKNQKFQNEVQSAISQLRQSESLASAIPRFMETLDSTPDPTNDVELSRAFRLAKDCGGAYGDSAP